MTITATPTVFELHDEIDMLAKIEMFDEVCSNVTIKTVVNPDNWSELSDAICESMKQYPKPQEKHMTKTEEIMEMVDKYSGDDHSIYRDSLPAYNRLKSAVEELVADAEKWRAYKARKDEVIAAGMGRNPMRNVEVCDTYGVINEDGQVEYSAAWPELCHDHIKMMQIDHGMGGKWKVRALKYLPVKTPRKKTP